VESAQGTQLQSAASKLLLQVHPTFLVFELQPAGELTPCLLHLTNDTDEDMEFKIRIEEGVDRRWSEQFGEQRFSGFGIVAARSAYTLILTVSWERDDIPENRFCEMILESWPNQDSYSEANKEEVKLTAYLSTQHRQSTAIPTATGGQLGVTISWMEEPRTRLYSVDAHPSKPWIITGHERGRVTIRNHDTQFGLSNSLRGSNGSFAPQQTKVVSYMYTVMKPKKCKRSSLSELTTICGPYRWPFIHPSPM